MRFDDFEGFYYLLKRGISIEKANKHGNNTVHFCVLLEKSYFLSYLLEGDIQGKTFSHRPYSESYLITKAN